MSDGSGEGSSTAERSHDGQRSDSPADSTDSGDTSLDRLGLDIRIGLAAHRPYAIVALGIFLCSMPAGWLLQSVGIGRGDLLLPWTGNAMYAQDLPLGVILGADTELFSLLVVGALTGGVLTVVGLASQGLYVGLFLGSSASELGAGYLVVSVVPHALPRALGFALAAAVGFRLVACGGAWMLGRRERVQFPREWRQAGLLLALSWLLVALSGLIEAFLTFRLLALL